MPWLQFLIGAALGAEAAQKVKELKLGERVLSFKWILGMFGWARKYILFYYLGIFVLVALYNFIIISHERQGYYHPLGNKMLAGDFDTVAMLEQYTDHLMVNLVEIIKN